MKTIILAPILALMVFSCTNNLEKKEYYENGNIKTLFEYTFPNDTVSYKKTEYYENGRIKSIDFKKNKIIDSVFYSFYANGRLQRFIPSKNGLTHGVGRYYDSLGHLVVTELYIEHKFVCKRTYKRATNTKNWITQSFEKIDDSLQIVGELFTDSLGRDIINRSNCYKVVNPKDTLPLNKPYTFIFKVYNYNDSVNIMSLTMGEILPTNKWKNKRENIVYRPTMTLSSEIQYTVTPKAKGHCFYTGELEIKDITTGEQYKMSIWGDYWVE